MSIINTTYWGEPIAYYEKLNVRTGATDLDDTDFTDYPPFTYSNMAGNETLEHEYDRVTLRSGIQYRGTYWVPDREYPDLSIAYCGINNPNLPQTNVICVGMGSESPAADYTHPLICFKSDPNKVKPVMFLSDVRYIELTSDNTYAKTYNSRLNDPYYYVSGAPYYGEYFWAPNSTDSTSISKRNGSYDMAYWRSFGIRSIIGIIYVRYYNPTTELNNTTKMPSTSHLSSLQWFESQTDEWKASQKIIAAWLSLKFRRSTTGSYETIPTNLKDSFMWDCYFGVESDGDNMAVITGKEKIYYPIGAVTTQSTNYDLPLFGAQHGSINYFTDYSTNTGGGSSTYFGTLVGNEFGVLKHGESSSTYLRRIWLERDGDASTELFRNAAAAYGLFFTDGLPTETGYEDLFAAGHDEDRWTNSNMCLGVVDSQGLTDGTYTRGSDNAGANNFGWKDSTESTYDPTKPPVPVMSYDSTTTFNDISNIATLTRRYALTKQDVEDLGSELWQISSDIINNIQNDEWYKYTADVMDTFLVTDPLSCIVSLQKYPLTIPEQSGPVNIKLGKAETSISANITKATAKTYYFTPVPIIPRFGNSFMDYEPYTHFELYVPFCGTTELDPRDILGRTLSVNLVVDFNTGTCVAYVLSDSLVIETINGSLAIDIPVTGVDSTTIASNITQGIINTRNARYTHQFGTLGKVASPSGIVSNIGNVWGSAQSILTSENNAKLSEYELTHQPAQPHVIGSASPVGSWAIDFKCRLLIYYPTGGIVDESKVDDSSEPIAFDSAVFEQYQSQIGFATVDPVSALGESYAHTLVCAEKAILNNVTTPNGRPATEPELQLIRQALAEGVILP